MLKLSDEKSKTKYLIKKTKIQNFYSLNYNNLNEIISVLFHLDFFS